MTTLTTRRIALVCALSALLAVGLVSRAWASPIGPPSIAQTSTAPPSSAKPDAVHDGASEAAANDSWWPTLAKATNLAVLVAILVYFLRSPLATYLGGRSDQIRKDLVDAAALRVSAEKALADVRARIALLPAELDDLRHRGQEELAAERVRLAEATTHARERLLEHTRRDIELQSRVARRALVEHVADLSVSLARRRIEHTITPADQTRLVDRYAAEVRV